MGDTATSSKDPGARTDESGYSLVEVLAAIVVLTVAVVPMVGMFDAALRAVQTSGDYDIARACVGRQLELARSLPYETVSAGLPDGTCGSTGFAYEMREEFVDAGLRTAGSDEGLTRVTVRVSWGDGNAYEAAGIFSRW